MASPSWSISANTPPSCAGTRYAFTHDKLSLLADHLLEGSGHMIRGKLLDYSAFGRTLLRRNAGQSARGIRSRCAISSPPCSPSAPAELIGAEETH